MSHKNKTSQNQPQNENECSSCSSCSDSETDVINEENSIILYNREKMDDIDESKLCLLFDLNFFFRRLDKIFGSIDDLKEQLEFKNKQANEIFDNINEIINKLYENKKTYYIEEDIETLNDLIFVAKKYGSKRPIKKYSVDTKILFNLIEPLEKLNNLIGLSYIKNQIVDQILTSLQDLYGDEMMFHTVIEGPPGVGKTLLAKMLGEIYLNMGILKNKDNELIFKVAKRSDLIGKFLGHTAVKTQNFINSCDGGVLFIDEVYSLGNKQKRDNFSKECIDTINLNLSEKKNIICIVAGYSNEIEECFFSYNPGLKRRFPFKYKMEGYNSDELKDIFLSKLYRYGWTLDKTLLDNTHVLNNFIEQKKGSFGNYGGDIDNLLLNCQIVHARRVFGKDISLKKVLTIDDIKFGFDRFMKHKKNKDNKYSHIYL